MRDVLRVWCSDDLRVVMFLTAPAPKQPSRWTRRVLVLGAVPIRNA